MVSVKKLISRLDTNFSGLSIGQKIVIIESDDWGAIRLPSISVRDHLLSKNFPLHEGMYTMLDGLEKEEDVKLLEEVLLNHKDSYGNYPIMTMNMVMFNPDFSKISDGDFEHYYSESIKKTYQRYEDSEEVLKLIRSGHKKGVFMPQFHGKEHVNVPLWMFGLQSVNDCFGFKEAAKYEMYGLTNSATGSTKPHIQATYDTQNFKYVENSIKLGTSEFNRIFGFNSDTFIPNNYVWNPRWNPYLVQNNIVGVQGMKYHHLPIEDNGKRKKVRLKFGKGKGGLVHTIRNCDFEQNEIGFDLNSTLLEISLAFKMKKPAIISSHRINYSSRISTEVRQKGLDDLNKLLKLILTKWPDVMFMSSSDLVNSIRK